MRLAQRQSNYAIRALRNWRYGNAEKAEQYSLCSANKMAYRKRAFALWPFSQNGYICNVKAKIGCGSAMKGKRVSLCIALALHYLCKLK